MEPSHDDHQETQPDDHQGTQPGEQTPSTLPEETKPELPAKIRYPPGYRFMPTDCELILEYLKKKIDNEPIPISDIKETYLKRNNPKALTEAFPKIGDNEWYFFTPRDRKYPNGTRPDRAADSGYWKATGADKEVMFEGRTIGFRKALVFYEGKPQKGQKTGWIMHEFRLNQSPRNKRNPPDMRLDDWVLCRIYEKPWKSTANRPNRKARARDRDRDDVNADDDEINPLEDVEVGSGDHHESSAAAVTNHENVVDNALPLINVVNNYENIPVPVQEDHYYHQEPIVNNTGDWFHQDLLISPHQDLQSYEEDLALINGHVQSKVVFDCQSVNAVDQENAFGNNIYLDELAFGFNEAFQDPAKVGCWNNEAFLSSCPANNTNMGSWNNEAFLSSCPANNTNTNKASWNDESFLSSYSCPSTNKASWKNEAFLSSCPANNTNTNKASWNDESFLSSYSCPSTNKASWNNEAFLSTYSCPSTANDTNNNNSTFGDPIYKHMDVEEDKKSNFGDPIYKQDKKRSKY